MVTSRRLACDAIDDVLLRATREVQLLMPLKQPLKMVTRLQSGASECAGLVAPTAHDGLISWRQAAQVYIYIERRKRSRRIAIKWCCVNKLFPKGRHEGVVD